MICNQDLLASSDPLCWAKSNAIRSTSRQDFSVMAVKACFGLGEQAGMDRVNFNQCCDCKKMNRRHLLQSLVAMSVFYPKKGHASDPSPLDAAAKILADAADRGDIQASSIYFQQGSNVFSRVYGSVTENDSMFLLASISKTISIAAVMSLYDEGCFQLDDPVTRYLPEFRGQDRENITVGQLMTHVSGLPDQLPENRQLRTSHAPLSEFVAAAMVTPLRFKPGTRYGYSSMAILLAAEIAQRVSGYPFAKLVQERVYDAIGMKHSAMGLGAFSLDDVVMNQVDLAAIEAGAGDPASKNWDWNSLYWRRLGAPWGGAHGSAHDVAMFLNEFLHPFGRLLKTETIRLMTQNHNPPGLHPRGLGFDLGSIGNTNGLSAKSFGHTGSTGTICWADPATETVCVILTTLPHAAVPEHPMDLAARRLAVPVK